MASNEAKEVVFSAEEVQRHVSPGDCWIIVRGKVYDISTFMDDHPGGDDVLLQAAGRDATEEFDNVGHSKAAIAQMETFHVGECPEVLKKNLATEEGVESETRKSTYKIGIWSKIFEFMVPALLLGVAFALRNFGKNSDFVQNDACMLKQE
ncbi:cytochrome b5 [Physcomitrium patens]|uniref:Cytochrome b5 heme-binding domain-containing protein n=2 Tax=Physcomitrium patens TaxID=3218 RepID=A9RTL6_PHYPA|nr:cytochrome b5-like [Physcomitrium patens]PNR31692.1 hypothetical protein PHYPA_025814 [Physcomitrium patens]|eukprot:XP_024359923.1 cytochrome b5-like [Physcomitrella patens]